MSDERGPLPMAKRRAGGQMTKDDFDQDDDDAVSTTIIAHHVASHRVIVMAVATPQWLEPQHHALASVWVDLYQCGSLWRGP
jgi:hypothetical protein